MGGRGRRHRAIQRLTLLELIAQAVRAGARQHTACETVGISCRTLQRWKRDEIGDKRRGPRRRPKHTLSKAEKDKAVALLNQPKYRNLSPEKAVAKAADHGVYVCSERSMRRILKERKQAAYRGRARPASGSRKPREYAANAPLRVLSWDITYLKSTSVRGRYFYLYLYVDVWSRRILGWRVHEGQTSEKAAELLKDVCSRHNIEPDTAVVHQDNGAPMRGSTFLATLADLGLTKSFSRPRVSDDNAFIESLFRHLKYVPEFPAHGFPSLQAARDWVERFVGWYNTKHLHSSIGYVTPDDRHHGRDIEILRKRRELYEKQRLQNPARWTRNTRAWSRPTIVTLNPERTIQIQPQTKSSAA